MRKILLFIFLVSVFSTTNSYANNEVVFSGDTKTIKELKDDLDNIEQQEKDISIKSEDFIQYNNLKQYVKSTLTSEEFNDLSFLISTYLNEKKNIETEISINSEDLTKTYELKKQLLDSKLELYKKMTSYIKPSKYQLYLEYIKSDTEIVSEKNRIETEKVETKDLMDKKVELLEEKIRIYKETLEKDLKKIIEDRLEERINSLEENANFIKLSNENKIKLLTKTIENAESKINELKEQLSIEENSQIFQESYNRKIEVYYISIQKIENFREKFEEIQKNTNT